jgi:hypothetical protein
MRINRGGGRLNNLRVREKEELNWEKAPLQCSVFRDKSEVKCKLGLSKIRKIVPYFFIRK